MTFLRAGIHPYNHQANRQVMMSNPPQWIVVVGSLVLTGCGIAAAAAQQGPAPDVKAIVLRYLRSEPIPPAPPDSGPGPGNLFSDPQKLGLVELSPPTSVQHPTLGWTWLACLRAHPAGRPASDYALFIGMDRIRDARLGVLTDRCATRSYRALGVFHAKKPDAPLARKPNRNR